LDVDEKKDRDGEIRSRSAGVSVGEYRSSLESSPVEAARTGV